jgi:lipopolysaccharide export system ATP-binding protein
MSDAFDPAAAGPGEQPTDADRAARTRARALVGRLVDGDRPLGLALRAVVASADDTGLARLHAVVSSYRDAFLAMRAREGHDVAHEAGRVPLDELREQLAASLLPRLARAGIVHLSDGGWSDPEGAVTIAPAAWREIAPVRDQLLAVLAEPVPAAVVPRAAPPAPALEHPSVLSATGLTKVYRGRRVVHDVALQVAQGEIVGLLGPNGAGKTTTFYMLVGLIAPQRGRILLDGQDITAMPMYQRARRGIGYLAQEPSVFRKLTVEQNILAILETLPLGAAERKARLEALLDELGLRHLRSSRAFQLSGGERRRLEITRALVTEPKFMMLDEPFAGIDPIAVHDIQEIVARLRERGIGVLISDHNVEQTLDIVDRAYIMYDGAVRVSGPVRDLVFDDTVSEIYLGPTLTARLRARYAEPEEGAPVR